MTKPPKMGDWIWWNYKTYYISIGLVIDISESSINILAPSSEIDQNTASITDERLVDILEIQEWDCFSLGIENIGGWVPESPGHEAMATLLSNKVLDYSYMGIELSDLEILALRLQATLT